MKRICGIALAFMLLLALVPVGVAPAVVAAEKAAPKEVILLAGSDFQVSGHNTTRIEQVLNTLQMHGISKADGAFFCGDYTLNSVDENQGQSTYGLATLKRLFTPIVGNKMTFVQGNHDPEDTAGLSKSGNNDPVSRKYGVYVIHEDQYLQYDWDYSRGVVEETAANLKKYLDEKANSGWNKPIFILSHVGLHWGNRTLLQGSAVHGDLLVDVLNEAGKKGLNIIFLFGHDHSGGYADFIGGGAVYFKKGDQIEVCLGKKKEHEPRTINFTYMNAGYIGYYSTTESACDATVTMSVFRIRGDEVIITRYNGNVDLDYGIHNLKSAGIWYPDYTQKGYHAEPDTRVYASSRKVTATDDVPVATPMPEVVEKPTQTTPTSTTVGNGVVVQKTTATKNPTTTSAETTATSAKVTATTTTAAVTHTTASSAAVGSSSTTTSNWGTTSSDITFASGEISTTTAQEAQTDTSQETQATVMDDTEVETMTTSQTIAEDAALPNVPADKQKEEGSNLWLILGIVAGVILIGAGAAVLFVVKKKQG